MPKVMVGFQKKEVFHMELRLTEDEKAILRHALEEYLSNLREEIVKTEKHEWKEGLHKEADVLKKIIGDLS
jgi:hypothetical protein